jgi:uncharacterized membrane protein YqaE (UPF0057 family)
MSDIQTNTLLLVIIAILIPPVAVGLKRGIGGSLIINIILTILFYIPGLIHALLVVLK